MTGDDPLFPGIVERGFLVLLIVFAVVFVGVLSFIVRSTVRGSRVRKDAGLDPMTAQAQLAAQASRSRMMAPVKKLEQRLVELDDLAARGVISADEHSAARARAIDGA